jgi:putative hydrolase of the HAD superfamily
MPYHVTWAHELEHTLSPADATRMLEVASAAEIPEAVATRRAPAGAAASAGG